jgi:hypothetical protein
MDVGGFGVRVIALIVASFILRNEMPKIWLN